MRRTTRPLAVTVLCLAGVALPMPGLAAALTPTPENSRVCATRTGA